MVHVLFYGDGTTAKVNINNLTVYESGLSAYKSGKNIRLDKAVKESLYEKTKAFLRHK